MKLFDSKNRYQEIWNYLSNKLTEEEEASLLDWVSTSERNSIFFNEVVADFNSSQAQLNSKIENRPALDKAKKYSLWKYSAAAGFLLLLTTSIFRMVVNKNQSKLSETILSNGIVITTVDTVKTDYDLENYMNNGIITLAGKTWIESPKGELTTLTIETSAGYYLLENAEVYIENYPSGNSTIQLFKGKARLIPRNKGGHEIDIRVGQKISFNKKYNSFTFSENTQLTRPI